LPKLTVQIVAFEMSIRLSFSAHSFDHGYPQQYDHGYS